MSTGAHSKEVVARKKGCNTYNGGGGTYDATALPSGSVR